MNIPFSTLAQLKQHFKPLLLRCKLYAVKSIFSYSSEDLKVSLRMLGLEAKDNVFVHSGFSRFNGFRGDASEVIQSLMDVIGPEGNLLMMSMAYRGSSQAYIKEGEIFDVAKTPSSVGLISEIFRRHDAVERSLNPLHPVLAYGPMSTWLTTDHEKLQYSCGNGSPFERFLNIGGKFLFFDVPFKTLTFMHYIEHYFKDSLPVEIYDPNLAQMKIRDLCGADISVQQHFFGSEARSRRKFTNIERELFKHGLMKVRKIGNTKLIMVKAQDIFDCAKRLIENGTGFYIKSFS